MTYVRLFHKQSCLHTVEKALQDALESGNEDYEELEDDFLFIANEGKVAIELVEEEV